MKRYEPQCYDAHDGGTICRMDEYAKGEWVRHADAETEVDKWKRVAVWAVMHRARIELSVLQSGLDLVADFEYRVPCDGTKSGILAALAKAAGEE